MSLYTATALSRASGATYRQVEYWTGKGYLRPVHVEGRPTTGSGNGRIYDDAEVCVARELVALTGDLGSLSGAIRTAMSVGAARVSPFLVLALDEGLES